MDSSGQGGTGIGAAVPEGRHRRPAYQGQGFKWPVYRRPRIRGGRVTPESGRRCQRVQRCRWRSTGLSDLFTEDNFEESLVRGDHATESSGSGILRGRVAPESGRQCRRVQRCRWRSIFETEVESATSQNKSETAINLSISGFLGAGRHRVDGAGGSAPPAYLPRTKFSLACLPRTRDSMGQGGTGIGSTVPEGPAT
jgi:hypothetical protein